MCQTWKAVADPFLFKQFSFTISPSRWHRSVFEKTYGALIKKDGPESRPWTDRNARGEQKFYKDWRLREVLLQNKRDGYSTFIRDLYIGIDFSEWLKREQDLFNKAYTSYVTEYLEDVCNILLLSERCLKLDLNWTIYYRNHGNKLKDITSQLVQAFRQTHKCCPQMTVDLKLGSPDHDRLYYENASQKKIAAQREKYEPWFMNEFVSPELFSNVSLLLVSVDQYTSPAFFSMLESVETLEIPHLHETESTTPNDYKDLATAISAMPSLKTLYFEHGFLPSFPGTLEKLDVTFATCPGADIDIWQNIANLSHLVDLGLIFDIDNPVPKVTGRESWYRPFEIRCTSLRKLTLYTPGNCKLLYDFVAAVLANAPLLELIETMAIQYSDTVLNNTVTRNLESLTIRMEAVRFVAKAEIHWDAIVSLLQRNPKIHTVLLGPVKFFAPISFDDIRQIAHAAPKLSQIVVAWDEKMTVGKWSTRAILRNKEERKLAGELVSVYEDEDCFDEERLSIDLEKFRALENRI